MKISKVNKYEEKGYNDFISKLKTQNDGIDRLIEVHGDAIYKAYLSQRDLKTEGIASFFTAQRIESILFQIIMKRIYEAESPSLEKHSKILRAATHNVADIRDIKFNDEKPNIWLSVSSTIFDFTHGESWAFFLNGGKSAWVHPDFFRILKPELKNEHGEKISDDLVKEIKVLYENATKELPSSILELVVIHDKENFEKTICFTEAHAENPQFPKTYKELLDASDNKLQARVLAPNPADPNKIKILRFTPDESQEKLNNFKDKVSQLIEKYNLGKPHVSSERSIDETPIDEISTSLSEKDDEHDLLLNILKKLREKIDNLKNNQKQNQNALNNAGVLMNELHFAITNYKDNKADPKITKEQAKKIFMAECTSAINNAKILLEKDLGWGDYLTNLLKALANVLIKATNSVRKAVGFQSPFSFFTPAKATFVCDVEEIENDLQNIGHSNVRP